MKTIKIILVNLLLIIIIFSLSEFVLFQDNKKKIEGVKYYIGKIPYKNLFTPERFRQASGVNFKNRPILIFGCSFAYGFNLDLKDTIGYKLSQLTKRPVYNYAVQGKGLQTTLYILQNNLIDNNIKNPEYAIYIMMSDHIRRLYSNVCVEDYVGQPVYKLNKNGEMSLVKDYFPVYKQFYTYYAINNFIYNNFIKYDYNRHNKYVEAYFRTIKNCLENKYPGIKFVVLMYGDKNNFGLDMSQLEKEGFIVLQTEVISGVNLLQRKYQFSDTDKHPVPQAWDIVAMALKDSLKL